jgi:hypothetical protein
MPAPDKRQVQETRKLSATIVAQSKAALEHARSVMHQVRNDAQRRANHRALQKVLKGKQAEDRRPREGGDPIRVSDF